MNTLQQRMARALLKSGLKKVDLTRLCKVSSGTVSLWFNGPTQKLDGPNLLKVAEVLDVNPEWLSSGKGEMELDSNNQGNIVKIDHRSYLIPIFDSGASMGYGKAVQEFDTVVGGMRLTKEWVSRNVSVSNPANLAILSAYGDSMSPTFNDGDILLVDNGITEIKVDTVYVLEFNNELFVKRIQRRLDGSIVIKSDNPLYDPHIVTNGDKDSLHILGRVLWAWNGKKL